MSSLLTGVLLTGLIAADLAEPGEVGLGPQPSPVPIAWEFEFTFLDPQRIEVPTPGQGNVVYWYVVYTVTNTSGRTQRFFPMFQIVTDDLRVLDTDTGIDLRVFEAIAKRHSVTHKYLVPPSKAIGAVLAGDDHAVESVAIWRQVDLTENAFRVYVSGLSGETQLAPNPAYASRKPESQTAEPVSDKPAAPAPAKYFTLRKTLEIRYTLPGSPQARLHAAPQRGLVRWVMR